jgi:hypothetical protein|tara:strand:+ start:465 stop:848 length:384 start_codon:yes stop_codon:yes gene_type:complete
MATNATWTVVLEDKLVIKQSGDGAGNAYTIDDNDFWGLAKWNNIWAIQYGTNNPSDTVEYRDNTPHSSWEDANLGDFQDFITRWDTAHLAKLQSDWDNNNEFDDEKNPESSEDKIARLGARPTSYSS